LLLVRRADSGTTGYAHTVYVLLRPATDGQAWEAQSGGVFRAGYPEGGGRKLLCRGERANIVPTGTDSRVPLATSPDNEAGTGDASAGRQSTENVGTDDANRNNQAGSDADATPDLFGDHAAEPVVPSRGERASGATRPTATAPAELTQQIDGLQREFGDRAAAGGLDPAAQAELERIEAQH
jgi:hypothetical protein